MLLHCGLVRRAKTAPLDCYVYTNQLKAYKSMEVSKHMENVASKSGAWERKERRVLRLSCQLM